MPVVVLLIFYAIPLIIFNQNWRFWSEYVQKKYQVAHSARAGVNNNKLQRTFRLLNLQKRKRIYQIFPKNKTTTQKIYRLMEYYHGRHFFSHFVPQFVCMIQRQKCYNCHVYSKIIRKPRTHKVLGKEPTQHQCRDLH